MMVRISAIAGAVFTDAIRRRVVLAVAFFGLVLAAAIPSLPSGGLGVVPAIFREVALALTFGGALVLTLALGANRLPSEIERRTIYGVLARPVARWEYLVGTWAGIVAVIGSSVAVFTVIEQVVGLVKYGDPMWVLWQGAFAIWLEMAVIAAFAVAVSSVTGPVVVVVAALTFLFAGHVRSSVVGDSGGLLALLYPSLETFDIINPVAHGGGVDAVYFVGVLAVFAGWTAALLTLGSMGLRRRDL